MSTIVHVSDFHFGKVHRGKLEPLRRAILDAEPDLVAVSGDLTQRARRRQFAEARAFLDSMPKPQIVVPGNHDVPLFNLAARFFRPLAGYRRAITADLTPDYVDDDVMVLGLNTTRSFTHKGGRINLDQARDACAAFERVGGERLRVVVTHHPFDVPEGSDEDDIVGRAKVAMRAFAVCGVDLFLAGHLHKSHAGTTAARYNIEGFAALVVQAGTATSSRGRGEGNAFNLLRIARPYLTVETHVWHEEKQTFAAASILRFKHAADGWCPV